MAKAASPFEGLAPGTTLVKVEAKDYVTFYKRNLRVQPGGTYDNYRVRLDKGEVVEGVVRGTDGKVIQGAYVALTQRDEPSMDGGGTVEEGQEAPDVEPSRGAQTDKDGRFRIVNVPRGTYSAVVWFARGYKSLPSRQQRGCHQAWALCSDGRCRIPTGARGAGQRAAPRSVGAPEPQSRATLCGCPLCAHRAGSSAPCSWPPACCSSSCRTSSLCSSASRGTTTSA